MKQQIIEALNANGFKHKYGDYYEKEGYKIKVVESETLETIFAKLMNAGATLKVWEFKRVMQIVDAII